MEIEISIGALQRNPGPAEVRYRKAWTEWNALKITSFSRPDSVFTYWVGQKFHSNFRSDSMEKPERTFWPPVACKSWSLMIKIFPSLAPFPILIPQILSAEQFSLFSPTHNLWFLLAAYHLEFLLFCCSFSFYCFTQVKPQMFQKTFPNDSCLLLSLSYWIFCPVYSQIHNKQFTKYTALLFLNQENNNILAWGQGLCLIHLLLSL